MGHVASSSSLQSNTNRVEGGWLHVAVCPTEEVLACPSTTSCLRACRLVWCWRAAHVGVGLLAVLSLVPCLQLACCWLAGWRSGADGPAVERPHHQ